LGGGWGFRRRGFRKSGSWIDNGIVFNSEWVPYDRRQDFLLEADLGVSMHFENLETRLSFRTRFLDYIWAGLPCVATEGDVFAEWIAATGTGRVVPYRDVEAIATAWSCC
jgi:glycosyltransferase involved in cell wall biosynthesis